MFMRKQKYKITKLCYMDTDNFIAYLKTDDTAVDVEAYLILQTINQTDDCQKKRIKKVVGLMKDVFGEKILEEYIRP